MEDKALNILNELKSSGSYAYIEDGKLQIKKPKQTTISPVLIADIRENKQAIFDFLSLSESSASNEKISSESRKDFDKLPLSCSQERIWFIDQFEGSTPYHMPTLRRIRGKLDLEALQYAFTAVINRHEILRTIYKEDEGNPFQVILDPSNEWPISRLYLPDMSHEEVMQLATEETQKAFNLSEDISLRATLITISEESHYFIIVMHHISSDGWSIPIFYSELMELYQSKRENRISNLKDLELQYADYACWQRKQLENNALDGKLTYWENKLTGYEPLNLPTDYPRPTVKSSSGALHSGMVSTEVSQSISELCSKTETTQYMFLLAALDVLLHKYTGQYDIVMGSPIANRLHKETEPLIGFFLNTVALRSTFKGMDTFEELLKQVRNTSLEAFQYQDVPIEKIIERVESNRDISRSTLIQTLFVFQNTPEGESKELTDIQLAWESVGQHTSKFDLTFTITSTAHGLRIYITYCDDLFKEMTIKRMMNHYKNILKHVVKDPTISIDNINILTQEEQNALLRYEQSAYGFENIYEIIQATAKQSPDLVAAHYKNSQLSYGELNGKANMLAHKLQERGVVPGNFVPVVMSRGLDYIISALAILKCGGAFAPLSIHWPTTRLEEILESLSSKVILTNAKGQAVSKLTSDLLIQVDADQLGYSDDDVAVVASSDDAMYVFHTSGTTGKPKGVVVAHGGVMNRLNWMNEYFGKDAAKSVLRTTQHIFDSSVWQIFWPLMNEGQTVIPSEDELLSAKYFKELVSGFNITTTDFVPALFSEIVHELLEQGISDELLSLREIVIGGEEIQVESVNQFKNIYQEVRITNLYGPTEASIGCVFHEVKGTNNKVIPIGKPIANAQVLVVSDGGQLAPVGVTGELYIGGIPVGLGYLQQDKTGASFVPNPVTGNGEEKWYKTGDLVKWTTDGDLLFMGRKDDQIKLRGYRIEPAEIESHIMGTDMAQSCKVILQEVSYRKYLVAYVIPSPQYNEDELMANLREGLPDYMVPAFIVSLPKFPLDSNGKINKKELKVDTLIAEEAVNGATTDTEAKLVNIWADLLGVPEDNIDVKKTFFELGGHSLLVIRLAYQVEKQFGIQLSLKQFFNFSSIVELGKLIDISKPAEIQQSQEKLYDL
ncbi:non-ribosomal peptide synthetase [Fulvivirga sediminis]|uniref:Amino acid adenylation domain-containing protein n=1 Tax=Fulvivirga sediminis TaxID=2803949 RepID=A0A937FBR2_9BACT|nr:non-ribosomal peptide synthetase [Fulvivirga sediminis]MBL3659086.1 amino acid adenylation domain-containing protein [Fulvivirga sediminis]